MPNPKFYITVPNAPKPKGYPVTKQARANKRHTRERIRELTEPKFKEVWE